MTNRHHRWRHAAALLGLLCTQGLLCSQAASAGVVSVTVATRSGDPVQDAVIVFDPLDASPAASHDTAVIDQVDKRFVPRVSVVRTGTSVTFPNSDQIRHQVYSFSPAKAFSLKLYSGSPKTQVVFDRPGLVILGCNIHDNMLAFVGVVDSPYFAKTTDSGAAALDLPSGRYRLRAWHPNAAAAIPQQEITVAAAPLRISLTIDVRDASAAATAWLE
jgi:plastocyanin